MASLRLFLRAYSRMRPEVLSALQSIVLPVYLPPLLVVAGGEGNREKQTAFQAALDKWIHEFRLPCTDEMKAEASMTLLHMQAPGRLLFWWDSVRETAEAMKRDGALRWTYSHPFKFEAPGWTPAEESIEEARQRLRDEFENTLKAYTAFWYRSQRKGADLLAVRQRDRVHFLNILWLAQKQACPALSLSSIARRHKVSEHKVRRGLRSAAECIGLDRESIHRAPPGRKSRTR